MPELSDIESLKSLLNSLGNEEALMAEKGLAIEDLQPGSGGLSEDISRLFASGGEDDLQLDSLPDSLPEGSADDGFGLSDDFGEAADFGEATDSGTAADFGEEPDFGGFDSLDLDQDLPQEIGEADFDAEGIFDPDAPEGTDSRADFLSTLDDLDLDNDTDLGEAAEFGEAADSGETVDSGEADDFSGGEILTGGLNFDDAGAEDDFETDWDIPETVDPVPDSGEDDFSSDGLFGAEDDAGDLLAGEDLEAADFAGEAEGADPGEDGMADLGFGDFGLADFGLPDDVEDEGASPAEENGDGDLEDPFQFSMDEDSPEGEDAFDLGDFAGEGDFLMDGIPGETPEEPEVGDSAGALDEAAPQEGFEPFSGEDDFDFGLGDGESGGPEETEAAGEEDFSLGSEDVDALAGDDLSENFDIADFNLGDIGEQFGLDSPDLGVEQTALPSVSMDDVVPAGDEGLIPSGSEDFSVSPEEFERIKATLDTLPRNLRLLIEEQIGEKGLAGNGLAGLLKALIAGQSPKQIAGIMGKITGRRIEIPAQYEKFTGLQFEEERGTFAYAFKNNILPILRVVLAAAAALGIVLFLGYRFIYTPLHAQSLYRKGVQEIRQDNYNAGNALFQEASEAWRMKKWYFNYAGEFIEKRQYPLAEDKYTELLRYYPGDRQGLLDFAYLESEKLGKYPQAEALIRQRLAEEPYDEEALLLAGDNYLRWGDELDPEKYEEARYHYALLIQRYGQKDPYLFKMLQYLMRVDKYDEIVRIKDAFQNNSRAKIDPVTYTDVAGYLMDKGDYKDVAAMLERVRKMAPALPELYYQFGRYYRQINDTAREEVSVDTTLSLLAGQNPESRKLLRILILSHNRKGELLYSKGLTLDAEAQFHLARERYEGALAVRRLQPHGEYGKVYANLGDLYYYQTGDYYDTAMQLYESAQRNLYSTPDISYKKGYIYNRREDYQRGLLEFYTAADGYSENDNLLYATALTLYQKNDYFLAQGYFNNLIDVLEQRRAAIQYLLVEEKPEHQALISNLAMTYNNMGVTLYKLYQTTGDPEKRSQSMVCFSRSLEYFDYLSRDSETLVRSESRNLAYLNLHGYLYPVPGFEFQAYRNIPKDMSALNF